MHGNIRTNYYLSIRFAYKMYLRSIEIVLSSTDDGSYFLFHLGVTASLQYRIGLQVSQRGFALAFFSFFFFFFLGGGGDN